MEQKLLIYEASWLRQPLYVLEKEMHAPSHTWEDKELHIGGSS